jgi:hypothetical protein
MLLCPCFCLMLNQSHAKPTFQNRIGFCVGTWKQCHQSPKPQCAMLARLRHKWLVARADENERFFALAKPARCPRLGMVLRLETGDDVILSFLGRTTRWIIKVEVSHLSSCLQGFSSRQNNLCYVWSKESLCSSLCDGR